MLPTPSSPSTFTERRPFWAQHSDASLSWLAFGLLLAAWSVTDGTDTPRARRPEALRGYSAVSVRAVHRAGGNASVESNRAM